MKHSAKRIWGGIALFLLLIMIVIYSFRVTLLMQAGRFMAPGGDYVADVAIMEGDEFIDRGVVKSGMKLLASGKVKRIVAVLHRIAPSHRPFALNEDYPDLVRKELEAVGMKGKDFKVIVTHIHHPVTLTAATGALAALAKEDVKSAILLSKGFHTRRSFLIYQHLGARYQIKIHPSACFNAYQPDRWWSQEHGVRDFAAEVLKLAYYIAGGYIPLKLSY
jgi:hypothetical protein